MQRHDVLKMVSQATNKYSKVKKHDGNVVFLSVLTIILRKMRFLCFADILQLCNKEHVN